MILIEMLKTFVMLPVWALIWAWQAIVDDRSAADEPSAIEEAVIVAPQATNEGNHIQHAAVTRDLAA